MWDGVRCAYRQINKINRKLFNGIIETWDNSVFRVKINNWILYSMRLKCVFICFPPPPRDHHTPKIIHAITSTPLKQQHQQTTTTQTKKASLFSFQHSSSIVNCESRFCQPNHVQLLAFVYDLFLGIFSILGFRFCLNSLLLTNS